MPIKITGIEIYAISNTKFIDEIYSIERNFNNIIPSKKIFTKNNFKHKILHFGGYIGLKIFYKPLAENESNVLEIGILANGNKNEIEINKRYEKYLKKKLIPPNKEQNPKCCGN